MKSCANHGKKLNHGGKMNYLVTGERDLLEQILLNTCLKSMKRDINIVVLDKLTYAGNLGTIRELKDSKSFFCKRGYL